MTLYCPRCGETSPLTLDTLSPGVIETYCVHCQSAWNVQVEFRQVVSNETD